MSRITRNTRRARSGCENEDNAEPDARPNDEERDQPPIPIRASVARSSSSVSLAFGRSATMSTTRIMRSHWVAFLFLVPAIILVILHRQLALSDALNVPTPPGEREAHLFNWLMVVVFYLGVTAFLLHTLSLSSRGWRLTGAKLVFLALYWCAILMFA